MDLDEIIELIEIAKKQKLKKLSFSNRDISVLPPQIGELTWLTSLDLTYNSIEELPKEFFKLKKLKNLYLYRNEIKQLPEKINELTSLSVLDLSHNKLEELPKQIGDIHNLTSLDLSYNKLEKLPFEIVNLTNLKKLYLENNDFVFPPQKVIKRGLYATMHFLFGELRKKESAKVVMHVYNFPQELLAPFKQYLDCFNDLISSVNQQNIDFDVKFIKQDYTGEVEIRADVENYIYEFVNFLKKNINNEMKIDNQDEVFNMQVIELKDQLNIISSSFETKVNEIKILQERIKSLIDIVNVRNAKK